MNPPASPSPWDSETWITVARISLLGLRVRWVCRDRPRCSGRVSIWSVVVDLVYIPLHLSEAAAPRHNQSLVCHQLLCLHKAFSAPISVKVLRPVTVDVARPP